MLSTHKRSVSFLVKTLTCILTSTSKRPQLHEKSKQFYYITLQHVHIYLFLFFRFYASYSSSHQSNDDTNFFTGQISPVEGTLLDVRKPKRLGDIIENLPNKDGLHFAHVIPGKKGEKKFVAR